MGHSTHQIAERLRHLEGSPTLALAAKAKALLKAGKPVVDLTAGEPDFPTPEPIKQAGIAAIQQNKTTYTPAAGIPELRAAVAEQLTRQLGLPYDASQVIISVGAKHALYNAMQAICEPGDEVIVVQPYWVSYLAQIRLAGATPVIVQTREADRFQPDPDRIARAVTTKTRALILNSPSNPTGMLIDRARLKPLAQMALRHHLIVISDEIYDRLVFPPAQACSIVQAEPALADQTIIVNGVSKTYSMTGWRIGYAAGPKALIEAMGTLQSHSTSNPTSISQHAALAAIAGDQREAERMCREFQQRRDVFVAGLNRLPGWSCLLPQGAFYAWCNISQLGLPADALAARALEEIHLAVVPGEGFGSSQYLRLSFAASGQTLEDALQRLERWRPTT